MNANEQPSPRGVRRIGECITAPPRGRLADGSVVHEYVLNNGRGMSLSVLDLGGIFTGLSCPDRHCRSGNVAVGLASLDDCRGMGRGIGSLIGRYAGRIAHARSSVDGQQFHLIANEAPNTLHGGVHGWGERMWDVVPPVPDARNDDIAINLLRPRQVFASTTVHRLSCPATPDL